MMDQNSPVPMYTSLEPNQAEIPKPKSSFRLVFLLLLIAALISAGATTYILVSGKNNPPPLDSATAVDNPFAEDPISANPFAGETSQTETVNPFTQEPADTDNPFSQFGEVSEDTGNNSADYQNPF